jgi:hypothetical protein
MDALICYDEQDGTVGHFVLMCAEQAHEIMSDIGVTIERISTENLSAENIQTVANQNGDSPFICAAFSHGSESSLINATKGEDYISVQVNHQSFRNVFFYTWACSSMQNLGPTLTKNGCAVYIGHVEPVGIPPPGYDSDILRIFVECALYGLRLFYQEGFTAVESVNRMRDFYDLKEADLLLDDPLAASYLLEHSNSLDIVGNECLTYKVLLKMT